MYNNDGVGVPQNPVKPDFNMEESLRMLEEYKGGHQQFPVDQETVDEFVKDYKAKHKMDDFVENEVTEAKAPDNPYSNFRYSLPETQNAPTESEAKTTDSEGNTLSEGQQTFFKDSKLRDVFGRLLRLFHGTTNGGFTKFSTKYSKDGLTLFLAGDRTLASTYSNLSTEKIQLPEGKQGLDRLFEKDTDKGNGQVGIYEVYANAKNPYVLDCNGAEWRNLPFTEKGKTSVNLEIKYDPWNSLTLKTTVNGTVHEKVFDFTLYEEEMRARETREGEDFSYGWGISKILKNQLYEYFASITNDKIALKLRQSTTGTMSIGEFEAGEGFIADNKTGKREQLNTRYVSAWAKKHGYDAVVFKNVQDAGMYSEEGVYGDVVVVFDSSQIKSVDNLNPTKNKDIRYSLPETEIDHDILLRQFENKEITREEYLDAINGKKNKLMNPVEIANLTEEDADTTPDLPAPKMVGEGDGESKLYDSLLESQIITDEVKREIEKDTYIKNYGTTTNKAELTEAADRLAIGGKAEVERFKRLEGKYANAIDVAEGIILLKRYQDTGDIDSALTIAEKLREIATVSGQTVQAFSIIGRFTPEMMIAYAKHDLAKAKEIMANLKTKEWAEANKDRFELSEEEIRKMTDNILLASNLEDGSHAKAILLGEITTMLQDKLPPERGQALRAWMRMSLLFNVKTNFRNFLGNASMIVPYVGSDLFGGLVDKAISSKTGVRTTGFDVTEFGKALVKGGAKGTIETIDDFKRKIHTKQEELNRFAIGKGQGKSFDEKFFHGRLEKLNNVAKALNEVDRLNSMFLELGDRPFFEMWFANELNTLKKLNKAEIPTKEMVEQAKQTALQRTWQDTNALTQGLANTKGFLNKLNLGGYGLGDVVLKFVKTPANIFKAMYEFSPVGFLPAAKRFNELRIALDNGTFTPAMQKEAVRSLSNAVVGTTLYLVVYALAASGALEISGGGDDDKDAANFEKYVNGIPPYSFKVGPFSVTYTWNQPIGTVIAIVADIMEDAEDGDVDWRDLVSTAGEVFTSQSFMKNVFEVFSKDDILSAVLSVVLSEPSAGIPTLLSQIASFIDPNRRTSYDPDSGARTTLNEIFYRIPFLRQTLPEQVNTLGEETKNPQYLNPWFAFADPSTQYPSSGSDVAQKVYDLWESTSDKTVFPRVAPNQITVKGKTVKFNAEEKAEIQKKMGTVSADILGELFYSEEYQKLTDEEKCDAVAKVYTYAMDKVKSELDIYDYDTLSAIVGEKNGKPILSQERYNRLDDKAKQMLVDEYFFSADERKCKGDPEKLAKLFAKNAKK
jgi:hypothetical protein